MHIENEDLPCRASSFLPSSRHQPPAGFNLRHFKKFLNRLNLSFVKDIYNVVGAKKWTEMVLQLPNFCTFYFRYVFTSLGLPSLFSFITWYSIAPYLDTIQMTLASISAQDVNMCSPYTVHSRTAECIHFTVIKSSQSKRGHKFEIPALALILRVCNQIPKILYF